jgi:uracil-DNA glycosylase
MVGKKKNKEKNKTNKTNPKITKNKMGLKLTLMPLYNPSDLRLEVMGTSKTLFAFHFPQIKALAFQTHVSFFSQINV